MCTCRAFMCTAYSTEPTTKKGLKRKQFVNKLLDKTLYYGIGQVWHRKKNCKGSKRWYVCESWNWYSNPCSELYSFRLVDHAAIRKWHAWYGTLPNRGGD